MVTVKREAEAMGIASFAVKAEHGGTLAWCTDEASARQIADALNNFWRYSDGSAGCSGCQNEN